MPPLPEQQLQLAPGRASILELRTTPDAIERAVWAVDIFAELCDRYRQEHRLPFGGPPDGAAAASALALEDAARHAAIWRHFTYGSVVGLDATLLEALDRLDGLTERAGEPGSERWQALLLEAGVLGSKVLGQAKSFQLMYRLQIGVIRMYCRWSSLTEWIASSAGNLSSRAPAEPRRCACGCATP